MSTVTQRHSLDTFVSSAAPKVNYETARILRVKSGEKHAFLFFSRSFPLGATILSATLTVRTFALSGSGTRSMTLRRTADKPFFSRMTWASQPGAISGPGEPVTVTKTGAQAGGTAWSFNVAAHLQKVADGAAWSGWRLETDSTSELEVYGVDYGGDNVATLSIEWSDAPDAPTQLSPAGGRVVGTDKPVLRWDYTDVSGDTSMGALQVQVSAFSAMTSPWDSGVIASSTPELDLAGTSFPGIPANGYRWWRVKVRDGAGLWSDWSDPARMDYVAKATLNLLSPAPGGTIGSPSPLTDATPPIQWALVGATQAAYRVRVWLNTQPKRPLWDTGRVTSTADSVTVPEKVLRWDDRRYRVQVDVWDTQDRVTTPGSTAAYTQETIALLDWDATLVGVDGLAARALNPTPHVELVWTRSEAPDGWVVVRGHEIVAHLTSAQTAQADGTHRWVDRGVPPRTELRYSVRPRVNGRTAWGNPASVVWSEPVGIWLLNDNDSVCIWGQDEGAMVMGETSAIHEPVRGDRVVQIRQGMRGYSGDVSGVLFSDLPNLEGVSARDWRDAFLRIKRDGDATLVMGSLAIPVLTAEMTPIESPRTEEQFGVSFQWWQRGAFDWDSIG